MTDSTLSPGCWGGRGDSPSKQNGLVLRLICVQASELQPTKHLAISSTLEAN